MYGVDIRTMDRKSSAIDCIQKHFLPGCQNVGEDGKAGRDYVGSESKSVSGKECVKWSEQANEQYRDVGEHNFCRNPSNWSGLWCYTSLVWDWEECDVPKCATGISHHYCKICLYKLTSLLLFLADLLCVIEPEVRYGPIPIRRQVILSSQSCPKRKYFSRAMLGN